MGEREAAQMHQEKVLRASEEKLGKDLALGERKVMNSFAVTLRDQGNPRASGLILRQLASSYESSDGENELDLQALSAQSSLAWALFDAGRLWEASRIQQEILMQQTRHLGPDHSETLTAHLDLAATLFAQRRFSDALWRQEQVVTARKRTLGDDHPHILTAQDHLAQTLKELGRFEEAVELQEQVLAGRQRVFGAVHPLTLAAQAHLASIFRGQGDLISARFHQENVAAAHKQVSGDDHTSTKASIAELALILKEQGDLGAASELLEPFMRSIGEQSSTSFDDRLVAAARQELLGQHDEEQALDEDDRLITQIALGANAKDIGNPFTTRIYFERSLSLYTETLDYDPALAIRGRNNIAEVVRAHRDLAAEHRLMQRLVDLLRFTLGYTEYEYEYDLGGGHLYRSQYSSGILESARELIQELFGLRLHSLGEDHADTLRAKTYLATILLAQGNSKSALKLFRQVEEAFVRTLASDHPEIWKARLHVARALYLDGDLAAARELLIKVLAAMERLLGEDHLETVTARLNLARALFSQGDLSAARELFKRVSETRERILGNDHPATSVARLNLARILYALGDLGATEVLERGALIALERRLGSRHPETLMARAHLASTLYSQGDFKAALVLEEQVLKARERFFGADHPETSRARLNLALSLRANGDIATARELVERAFDALEHFLGDNHPTTIKAMFNLAVSSELAGELDKAEKLYLRVLERQRKLIPQTLEHAIALEALAALRAQTRRPESSARLYLQALAALEGQIGRVGGSPDLQGAYRAQHAGVYRRAIEFFAATDRREEALRTLERYHGRSFLAMLNERELVFSDVPEGLDRARRALAVRHDRIVQQMSDLDPILDQEEIQALAAERLALRQQYGKVGERIRRATPGTSVLQEPRPLSPQGVRRTLDPGTAILAYSVGKERTSLFVVRKEERPELHLLEIGEEKLGYYVEQLLKQTHGDWLRRAASRFALAKLLYKVLIEPAAASLADSERVLLIPDGPLHRLPFATLIRETEEAESGWQYLIEWKPLHLVLSATVYAQLKGNRRELDDLTSDEGTAALAAFGDPLFSPSRTHEDVRVRFVADQHYRLNPLPYTRLEVEQIAGYYPAGQAFTYLGEDATEERVKALSATDTKVVHFATHHYFVPYLPLDSFLALTIPGQIIEGRDNGLLQVWEVFERLRIEADLVVLSACESALGRAQAGEGLVGLTRAFQHAGARSVVASLWNVLDQTTTELMVRFYRHLQAGASKDEALRAAQIELIREPIGLENEDGQIQELDLSAPYYWGAFQIYGDWR